MSQNSTQFLGVEANYKILIAHRPFAKRVTQPIPSLAETNLSKPLTSMCCNNLV
jgi:hypothetical protein